MKAGLPLYKKPLTLNAVQAGNWFHMNCYESDPNDQIDVDFCKKNASFVSNFKSDYGVDPNRDNTWVLAYLYRRHLEGGQALVAEWQRIGLDLSGEFGAAPSN